MSVGLKWLFQITVTHLSWRRPLCHPETGSIRWDRSYQSCTPSACGEAEPGSRQRTLSWETSRTPGWTQKKTTQRDVRVILTPFQHWWFDLKKEKPAFSHHACFPVSKQRSPIFIQIIWSSKESPQDQMWKQSLLGNYSTCEYNKSFMLHPIKINCNCVIVLKSVCVLCSFL